MFSNLSGLRRREWNAIRNTGGGIDRRYRLRSWFLSLSAFANDLTPRPWFSATMPADKPPLFILGHWRSGTTLLHEVTAMDARFAAPTLVDVLTPTSSAPQRWIIDLALRVFLPCRRPIDGMTWGPHRPAEDDLAFAALATSPYLAWSFPRSAAFFERYLDLIDLSVDERDEWRRSMVGLVARWTERHRKALVLKSPPHTGRTGELASLFPAGMFVFVHRHPYATFASTMRLVMDGTRPLRLQELSDDEARAGVLRRAVRMFAAYQKARKALQPDRLIEIAYEDLIKDPAGVAQDALARLGHTPDPTMAKCWIDYQKTAAPVRPTPKTELAAADKADVRSAFRFLFEEFGYEP